jgi:hypothetical protein
LADQLRWRTLFTVNQRSARRCLPVVEHQYDGDYQLLA